MAQTNGAIDSANPHRERAVDSAKVWTTLITNTAYLSGLLTLDYSLKLVGSKYPLVALYTDSFPAEGLAALKSRNIPHKHIPYLLPKAHKDFTNDPRFYDCWSKLTPFSLVEYERVVQLDSDMLVLQNMDELMDIPLDAASAAGKGERVFAASHACLCNPLSKPHYPRDWIPQNCAFTHQHDTPERAQTEGMPADFGITMPNGGLQVVIPCAATYELILAALEEEKTSAYDFSDQSLLGDVFHGRWVALPYVYNALKTLRWEGVHAEIWRDARVKNVHYILSPKPWDETEEDMKKPGRDGSNEWWWTAQRKRTKDETARGIDDGF
ncbi:nucleotide-diphospho-sugar transferase [Neohortaea acidophila]|uniref:Nucleotide-diphospho-sugar transferase n=1 Tax=Neohortaea acidophila TaxID=245834 RepID=A0A6A6Q1H3_9PEZI|nr:nucleotide-diphospho-sugar transferase [Neohortaea acidophila]KAF2485844.1 nucleotide-diphospho-sugar transferase [Neohortaea acidophila]